MESFSDTVRVTAQVLEHECEFTPRVARGTMRIALKEAGIEPDKATIGEMDQVVRKTLPTMLYQRGIRNPQAVCRRILHELYFYRSYDMLH